MNVIITKAIMVRKKRTEDTGGEESSEEQSSSSGGCGGAQAPPSSGGERQGPPVHQQYPPLQQGGGRGTEQQGGRGLGTFSTSTGGPRKIQWWPLGRTSARRPRRICWWPSRRCPFSTQQGGRGGYAGSSRTWWVQPTRWNGSTTSIWSSSYMISRPRSATSSYASSTTSSCWCW